VAVVQVPMVKQTFAKYDRVALVRSAQQHHDLVAAIRARDGAWARATMAAHILAAKNVIFGS
jgi:DNA-binding FadR family transcriptional regulator